VAEVADEAWEMVKSKVLTMAQNQTPEKMEEIKTQIGRMVFLNSVRRLPPLNMVRADLDSIMEALLQNALEAVLTGSDPRIVVLGEKDGDRLELTVRDNGRGMSENVLKHAREPFFSTKGEVGVGLSLSLVSSLVIRHGGELSLQSVPGAGTTAKVTFSL
jgi:signal transduction histidine kinase